MAGADVRRLPEVLDLKFESAEHVAQGCFAVIPEEALVVGPLVVAHRVLKKPDPAGTQRSCEPGDQVDLRRPAGTTPSPQARGIIFDNRLDCLRAPCEGSVISRLSC